MCRRSKAWIPYNRAPTNIVSQTALASILKPKLLIDTDLHRHHDKIQQIVTKHILPLELQPSPFPVYKISPSDFDNLALALGMPNPQENEILIVPKVNDLQRPILVLDQLKYNGNIGSIIRSSVQFGCFESIYSITPEVVARKTLNHYSIRSVNLIDFHQIESAEIFLETIWKPSGRDLICLEMSDFAKPLHSADVLDTFNSNTIFVLGNEDIGICDEILNATKNHVVIPSMFSSINVAQAFSILAYELSKQLDYL